MAIGKIEIPGIFKTTDTEDYLKAAVETAKWISAHKVTDEHGTTWEVSCAEGKTPDQVEATYLSNRTLYSGSAGIGFFFIQLYEVTGDPDEVLRTAVADCFDDDEDGVLSSEEIGYAEILDVHGSRGYGAEPSDADCKSLEGIEYLPNLLEIYATSNAIEEVDLSKNEKLVNFHISNNNLKELDLSVCPSLAKVSCDYNKELKSIKLDNPNLAIFNCFSCSIEDLDLSSLESLDYLHCGNNLLTEIDLSNNPNLRIAYLRGNDITELDVSKNINLEDLGIDHTPMESIDVSANENLKGLSCGWSNIKTLDLSHNPNLDRLIIDDAPIKTIDVSANPKLNFFSCQDGEITELDFSNNPEMQYLDIQFLKLKELDISNCPMLIDVVENGEKNPISDRQVWDGVEGHEGQIQVPLNCKLIY